MQEKRGTEKQRNHQEKRYERRDYSLRRRSKPLETFLGHSLRPFKLWTRDPEQRMKSGIIHIPRTNGASSQERDESTSKVTSVRQVNRTIGLYKAGDLFSARRAESSSPFSPPFFFLDDGERVFPTTDTNSSDLAHSQRGATRTKRVSPLAVLLLALLLSHAGRTSQCPA